MKEVESGIEPNRRARARPTLADRCDASATLPSHSLASREAQSVHEGPYNIEIHEYPHRAQPTTGDVCATVCSSSSSDLAFTECDDSMSNSTAYSLVVVTSRVTVTPLDRPRLFPNDGSVPRSVGGLKKTVRARMTAEESVPKKAKM